VGCWPPGGVPTCPPTCPSSTRRDRSGPTRRLTWAADDPTSAPVRSARGAHRLQGVPTRDGRLTHELDPNDRGPQDACGVLGVWAPGEEVAKLAYFGTYALQHRGQESAGIAVGDGRQIL